MKNIIPFDQKYRPEIDSKKYQVETKEGFPIRILCWDRDNPNTPIVALKKTSIGEDVLYYNLQGNNLDEEDTLFIVTDEDDGMTEFERYLWNITSLHYPDSEEMAQLKSDARALYSIARKEIEKELESVYGEYLINVANDEFNRGKSYVLKELPAWEKDDNNISSGTYILDNRGDGNIFLCKKGLRINILDLAKLPKEE